MNKKPEPIESHPESNLERSAWQSPAVSRMRAGKAEVGFTNTVTDGPGLSKS
jgi:hypothetical protein